MSEPTLAERFRIAAEDPMWADHVEIPKSWCKAVAEQLEAAERRVAGLEAALHSSKITLIGCLHLVASHKFSPEDYEGTQQRIDASGSRFSYFADAVEQIDIALSAAGNNGWREMDSAPKDQEVLIAYWRWRNSMSPGKMVAQSAMMTEFHGEGIWSWVVSDNKHGPFPIRGWCDGDIIGWQPLPPAPQVRS